MSCSHIVECLRNKGIEPEAFSSSVHGDNIATWGPANALDDKTNTYFNSKYENKAQFWGVFFKRPVSILGYEILTGTASSSTATLYNWTFSLSMDNKKWDVVHGPAQSTSTTKSHTFSEPLNALYARIDGNSLYSNDKTEFWFYYIKFFGSITKVKNRFSCKFRRRMNTNLMQMIFILTS